MAKEISISQCMIVKNEEKNIRRALSWGKNIVQEQIVVDTGSTDKTVEIAENMGAKIFHFKWCDDFSAAKNYAIERASGDWIAFLDADEYLNPEDAGNLPGIIRTAEMKFSQNGRPDVIRATWAQLNDEGKVFAVSEQDRIFRNSKDIRYRKSIHEVLTAKDRDLQLVDATETLSIMHTGYLRSVIVEKGKRNVPLLKKIVQNNPDDYDSWAYLAEAFSAEDNYTEALRTAEKVLEEGLYKAEVPQINTALMTWFTAASSGKAGNPEQYRETAYALYERYCKAGFSYPDIEFGMGCYLQKTGDTKAVIHFFEIALQKLEQYKGVNALKMAGHLNHIYAYLAMYYSERQNAQRAVYYCTLSLRVDKYQDLPFSCLLKLLKNDKNTTAEQAYVFLGKIYELSSSKDCLFILKQAIKTGYQELKDFIRSQMPVSEIEKLDAATEIPWITDTEELKKRYPQIPVMNRTDRNFLSLIGELEYREISELCKNSLVKEIAENLKKNREDIRNLYEWLSDYRSKHCLYGILETWMHRENRIMFLIKDNGLEFWDMDILPSMKGMVCANIGANLVETLNGFLYIYEETYQKIFCFSGASAKGSSSEAKNAFAKYNNIFFETAILTELRLDETIKEPLDFIRIDVSTALFPLLEGSRTHIINNHPKLAICLDSDCRGLWEIPKLLKKWNKEYHFYLRYYGSKAVPDRIVLFAV